MAKLFFYCDESGAKGYANQDEAYPGEVGVMAGIMIPEECISAVKSTFDQLAARYMPSSGKLHISDLSNEQQGLLRNELFAEIKRTQLPCFWYAIHVAGLHEYHSNQTGLLRQSADELHLAHGGNEPRIKRGSLHENPVSLHIELFSGLYSHLVAFLVERDQECVDIEILTDQVDTPIMKRFEEVASNLLNNDPAVLKTTGFDTFEKKVVHGSVTSSVQWLQQLDFSPVVKSLSIKTVPQSDGLVLAADVLANSLNYLFKNRSPNTLYARLNCINAVANHPLEEHLDAFINWGSGDLIGDGIYQHPKASN